MTEKRLIVGKSFCPSTVNAVAAGFTDNVLMLDHCANGQELHDMLIEETGQRTVPYVLEGNTLIGGYTELRKMLEAKKMKK